MLSADQAGSLGTSARGCLQLEIGLRLRAGERDAADAEARIARLIDQAVDTLRAPAGDQIPILVPDAGDVPCFPVRLGDRWLPDDIALHEALEAAARQSGFAYQPDRSGTPCRVMVWAAARRSAANDQPTARQVHARPVLGVSVRTDLEGGGPPEADESTLRDALAAHDLSVHTVVRCVPDHAPVWPLTAGRLRWNSPAALDRAATAWALAPPGWNTLVDGLGRRFTLALRLRTSLARLGNGSALLRDPNGSDPDGKTHQILVLDIAVARTATPEAAERAVDRALGCAMRALTSSGTPHLRAPESRHVPFLPGALADGTPIPDEEALHVLLTPSAHALLGHGRLRDKNGATVFVAVEVSTWREAAWGHPRASGG